MSEISGIRELKEAHHEFFSLASTLALRLYLINLHVKLLARSLYESEDQSS